MENTVTSNTLQEKFPEIAQQWNDSKNGDMTPEKIPANSKQVVWWVCRCGHEWQDTVAARTSHTEKKCPFDAAKGVMPETWEKVSLMLEKEWNQEKNGDWEFGSHLSVSSKRFWWKDADGHEWQETFCSRIKTAAANVS